MRQLAAFLDGLPRKGVVAWALSLAEETVGELEQKYPDDTSARQALELAGLWAGGAVKMPIAKRAILDCHATAKKLCSPEDIAHYHAVGQACATVHACGHAIGYPIYDLTALIRKNGVENCQAAVSERLATYYEKGRYWQEHCDEFQSQWAGFLERG